MNREKVFALKLLEVSHDPLDEKLPVPANPSLAETGVTWVDFSKRNSVTEFHSIFV
jgi:hypothetical protein